MRVTVCHVRVGGSMKNEYRELVFGNLIPTVVQCKRNSKGYHIWLIFSFFILRMGIKWCADREFAIARSGSKIKTGNDMENERFGDRMEE